MVEISEDDPEFSECKSDMFPVTSYPHKNKIGQCRVIWTLDPFAPNEVLYQAELHTDSKKMSVFKSIELFFIGNRTQISDRLKMATNIGIEPICEKEISAGLTVRCFTLRASS